MHNQPLVVEQLDRMMCDSPGCDHKSHDGLWLHPACHPGAGTNILYRFGALHIECKRCKRSVADIKVGSALR